MRQADAPADEVLWHVTSRGVLSGLQALGLRQQRFLCHDDALNHCYADAAAASAADDDDYDYDDDQTTHQTQIFLQRVCP